MGAADLLLQLDDAVDQGFRRGGAARHIDSDRHDAVTAAHHGIAVVVVAAAVGARAHGDDPAGLGHLAIDPAHGDRKSTPLNSSHPVITYAGFCLSIPEASAARPAAGRCATA